MWVVRGSQSLAVVLASQGFDVWIGNNRGNIYGRINLKFDPKRNADEFFDYSFYENAKYDMIPQIERALEISGQPKLTYVAHSQGTTQMFAMLSDVTVLNDKIDMFIACAPIVYLTNIQQQSLKILS